MLVSGPVTTSSDYLSDKLTLSCPTLVRCKTAQYPADNNGSANPTGSPVEQEKCCCELWKATAFTQVDVHSVRVMHFHCGKLFCIVFVLKLFVCNRLRDRLCSR